MHFPGHVHASPSTRDVTANLFLSEGRIVTSQMGMLEQESLHLSFATSFHWNPVLIEDLIQSVTPNAYS